MTYENEEYERDEGSDFEEGELYVYKKGEMQHVARDPDDTMRKVRITDDAFNVATLIQRQLRRQMNGYKPDIVLVCSALLESHKHNEEAVDIVRRYVQKTFNI